MSSPRMHSVERWLRNVGASILAASALISAPFVVFALSYKSYIYAQTGHWYAWGAPTQIGTCNRIISYALVVLTVIGVAFLSSGHVIGAMRRRHHAHAHPTSTLPLADVAPRH